MTLLLEYVAQDIFYLFYLFFIFFIWPPCSIWSSRARDLSCSLKLSNTESLTHCARLGIEPVSQRPQDATSPIAHWELLPYDAFGFILCNTFPANC